jgi:hypothetical protein
MASKRLIGFASTVAALVVLLSLPPSMATGTVPAEPPVSREPADLTGEWSGKVGGVLHGSAEITIVQDGESGELTGTMTTRERGDSRLTGEFTAYGREVNGDILIEGETRERVKFVGKANWKGSRLNWTLTLLDGTTATLRAGQEH